MNVSDAERIAKVLQGIGYIATCDEKEANLIVAVTCSVRQTAEDRVYGAKKKWQKYKKKNPALKVVLTGCMADREEVRGRLSEVVDYFININDVGELGRLLNRETEKQKNRETSAFAKASADKKEQRNKRTLRLVRRIGGLRSGPSRSNPSARLRAGKVIVDDYLSLQPEFQSKFQAYVPISTGCDNFCTYCIVPYARGRERSRPESEILCEVEQLVKRGYKEITLLGQNVNSYKTREDGKRKMEELGANNKNKTHFVRLLEKINAIPGNFWIKFTSPHPKDMGDDLINAIAELDKVCERVHLPVQGGDNAVLKQMNRKYTREQYLDLVKKVRLKIKNVCVITDIIVGFPGETRKQFLQSVDLFKKAKFDMAYISRFSPRPGTAAAKMKDNVSWDEKRRRDEELTKVLQKTALVNNKKYVGRIVDVLVCGEHRKQSGKKRGQVDYLGITRTDKKVKFSGPVGLVGEFVRVKIQGAKEWGLGGKIVR